jgi:hypothetical protein
MALEAAVSGSSSASAMPAILAAAKGSHLAQARAVSGGALAALGLLFNNPLALVCLMLRRAALLVFPLPLGQGSLRLDAFSFRRPERWFMVEKTLPPVAQPKINILVPSAFSTT